MNVWKKQTIRWQLDGKNVPRGTSKAKRHVIESKRFYGTLKTSDGKRKQVPLTEERDTSETLLRRLQTQEDTFRASGVSRQTRELSRPLSELLTEYETFMRSKGNTSQHVEQTITRIRVILVAVKAKTLDELESSKVSHVLSVWRLNGRIPKTKTMSVETSNHYMRAVKGFTRWLWQERKTSDDCLSPLRLMNSTADRRRTRRAFTADEIQRLLKATRESGKRLRGLRAVDRSWLYTLAVYTGLRASELASLTTESVDIETGTVSVKASYSKRRRNDVLPLHASLLKPLSDWLSTKTGTLFPGTWAHHRCSHGVKMFRSDLKRAGIEYVDSKGRYSDFHSLRHTFISSLARSGVHPAKAKELARHSTITLTMDVYSHVETDELRSALNSLPSLE